MGWLFADALGMQRRSVNGVWRALAPIALGHALSVAVVVIAAALAGVVVQTSSLRTAIAVMLIALGTYRLWRHRHPRFGGMQVNFRDLTAWSFLMASAHGAGLMVLPLLVGKGAGLATAAHAGHVPYAAFATVLPASGLMDASLWAALVHTAGYLTVTGLIAVTVYRRLGLRLLRTLWINLDLIWGGALVLTGALTLIL